MAHIENALLTKYQMQMLLGLDKEIRLVEAYINELPASREKSLALTKLEEAQMWAAKAIQKP